MVRMTTLLLRVPVIKFRKGGLGAPPPSSPPPAAKPSPASVQPQPAGPQAQPAAAMSTASPIPDVNLPARYRRMPLSEEEIDHINGGGIV